MKKGLCIFILATLLLTNFSFASEQNNQNLIQNEKHQEAIATIQAISRDFEQFSNWSSYKITYAEPIYNAEGTALSDLYLIKNDIGIAGYVILEKETNTVVEFAEGEPYFSTYLEKYSIEKGKSTVDRKLVMNGIVQSVTYDNFNTVDNFSQAPDIKIDVDFSKAVESNVELNSSDLNSTDDQMSLSVSSVTEKKILSGVPDHPNFSGSTPACGPMSMVNINYYWGSRGYSNLTGGKSTQEMYNLYYQYMKSFPLFGGNHGTLPNQFADGISTYFNNFGYGVNVKSDLTASYNNYDEYIKNPILNNCPGIVLYNNNSPYGLHYVILVGYAEQSDGQQFYIFNPQRDTPQIWRNFSYDTSISDIIWGLYAITPN